MRNKFGCGSGIFMGDLQLMHRQEINLVMDLLEYNETYLKSEAAKKNVYLILFEAQDEIDDSTIDLTDTVKDEVKIIEKEMINLSRKNALISLVSIFESWIKKVCDDAMDISKFPLSTDDVKIKTDGNVKLFFFYLKKAIKMPSLEKIENSHEYQLFQDANKVRNKIVHELAFVKTENSKIIRTEQGIELKDNRIFLEKKYVTNLRIAIVKCMHELQVIFDLWKKKNKLT